MEEQVQDQPSSSHSIRHFQSKTTSFSPKRRRTRPYSPSRLDMIREFKYKTSVYKRKNINYYSNNTGEILKKSLQ